VEEVPLPEEPLLTLDEQPAIAGQHKERLLVRLGVIHAARLTRLEHAESDADLRELHLLALVLEGAIPAAPPRRPPLGVSHVHDEPALGRRCKT
jgi:hypothetical protein